MRRSHAPALSYLEGHRLGARWDRGHLLRYAGTSVHPTLFGDHCAWSCCYLRTRTFVSEHLSNLRVQACRHSRRPTISSAERV
ncbi:hypothetical protein F2Q68_00002919 [Brassica cretica]|uniref:Uncharacterized protein n=1 Tax=Brassica cretica TaxID=69181 RepID=A0A8S9JLW4_BRACR|nr:hypothetical protein F2Q68_00002919 [Brassica cretica]